MPIQNFNRERRMEFFHRFGDFPIACSAVYDPEMGAFESSKGFYPCVDCGTERIALGDPLCAAAARGDFVAEFLADAKEDGKNPVVLQCSFETACAFSPHGFSVNHMGMETNLVLPKFNTAGKAMAKVRRWLNTAQKAGVRVREERWADAEALVRSISERWLAGKINTEELKLLTRPLPCAAEPDTRLFCSGVNGETDAFVLFEPLFSDGKVMGYYADFVRSLDSAASGSLDLIYSEAGKVFRAEGVELLTFGLSPLADLHDEGGRNNPIVSSIFGVNYSDGNSMYAYQNLDAHKKAYCDGVGGVRVPKYMVIAGALPLNQMMNVFHYIGIMPDSGYLQAIRLFGPALLRNFFKHAPEAKQEVGNAAKLDSIVGGMLGGESAGEIAKKTSASASLVSRIGSALTGGIRRLLPEIERQALFFSGNFDATTEKLYIKVSNLVDAEEAIHFIHRIVFVPAGKGRYNLLLTAEVAPATTVQEAYALSAAVRKKLAKKIPELRDAAIVFEPDGAFFARLEKLTLEASDDEALS